MFSILRVFVICLNCVQLHIVQARHEMITVELDRLLVHLAKVETGLSRVYEWLSKKENFRPQVQGFWFELMN